MRIFISSQIFKLQIFIPFRVSNTKLNMIIIKINTFTEFTHALSIYIVNTTNPYWHLLAVLWYVLTFSMYPITFCSKTTKPSCSTNEWANFITSCLSRKIATECCFWTLCVFIFLHLLCKQESNHLLPRIPTVTPVVPQSAILTFCRKLQITTVEKKIPSCFGCTLEYFFIFLEDFILNGRNCTVQAMLIRNLSKWSSHIKIIMLRVLIRIKSCLLPV